MGDGLMECQSDIRTAFEDQERVHGESGKKVRIAGTSCRMVSFASFEKELADNGLEVIHKGLTAAPPDFSQMLYALVRKD